MDLEELFEVSDSIAVICEGTLSEIHAASDITVDEIGLLMAGIKSQGSISEEVSNAH